MVFEIGRGGAGGSITRVVGGRLLYRCQMSVIIFCSGGGWWVVVGW